MCKSIIVILFLVKMSTLCLMSHNKLIKKNHQGIISNFLHINLMTFFIIVSFFVKFSCLVGKKFKSR